MDTNHGGRYYVHFPAGSIQKAEGTCGRRGQENRYTRSLQEAASLDDTNNYAMSSG